MDDDRVIVLVSAEGDGTEPQASGIYIAPWR